MRHHCHVSGSWALKASPGDSQYKDVKQSLDLVLNVTTQKKKLTPIDIPTYTKTDTRISSQEHVDMYSIL